LSYEKISKPCKYKLILTKTQKERLGKSKILEKARILELNYDQLKVNYSGGFLPISFSGLAALGGLPGRTAAVTNAVIRAKHQSAKEEEEEDEDEKT
jgi:hypothetical protein